MMIGPFVLLLISVLGMALTWEMPDLFLLAVLSAVASLVILLLGALRGERADEAAPRGLFRRKPKQDLKWAVIDGSNVMYWRGGTPQLDTVKAVMQKVAAQGFTPGVMFDANAGYLLEDKYLNDAEFAKRLGLPRDRVMVVPKGVQADAYLLTAARDLGAVIVSNDRFRDWVGDYPEVAIPGHVVQGAFRDAALWLDLPA